MASTPGQRTTAVVVAWEAADRLTDCLTALLAEPDLTVVVVDNASTDATTDLPVLADPRVTVLTSPSNLGFAGGVNLALRGPGLDRELVALVNDDAVVPAGWLAALVDGLCPSGDVVAVTGPVLLADGRLNSAGGTLARTGHASDRGFEQPYGPSYDTAVDCDYLPATALLLRSSALAEVACPEVMAGDFFLYYEDVDLGLRLRRAGGRLRYLPAPAVRHGHGVSSGAGGGSDLHRYHDTRNRLLVLLRHAPLGVVLVELARLPVSATGWARAGQRHRAVVMLRAWLAVAAHLRPALALRRSGSRAVRGAVWPSKGRPRAEVRTRRRGRPAR